MAQIEHVNITVSDPQKTAHTLCQIYDWHIRWSGPSQLGGNTVHVGTEGDYLAVYTPERDLDGDGRTGKLKGGLNHVGIVVDNLDQIEARVIAQGFQPFNHEDYEPGRRFYYYDADGIEFEVVSYA